MCADNLRNGNRIFAIHPLMPDWLLGLSDQEVRHHTMTMAVDSFPTSEKVLQKNFISEPVTGQG